MNKMNTMRTNLYFQESNTDYMYICIMNNINRTNNVRVLVALQMNISAVIILLLIIIIMIRIMLRISTKLKFKLHFIYKRKAFNCLCECFYLKFVQKIRIIMNKFEFYAKNLYSP